MNYLDQNVTQAAEVVQSFMTISKSLSKFAQQNANSLGLSLPQMGILNIVYSSPGITLKEITEKLSIPKSTVSVGVDDLVNLKLIERKIPSKDRREISLRLTTEGEELSKKSCQNALSYKAMMSVLEKISVQEIQSLLEIHKKISIGLLDCKEGGHWQ